MATHGGVAGSKATTTATNQRAGTQLTTNSVVSGIGDLRSVAGYQAERADGLLPIEAMKYSANITGASHQYEHYAGKLWDPNKCFGRRVSVIRRVKKSEAIDGSQVRLAAIPSEKGDLLRWKLGSIEVNEYERYDGFADTQALKVFLMSTTRAASQRHTEHGTRKITAILDAAIACFRSVMDELVHAHGAREAEPECIVVWLLFKAHSGGRRAARLWQEYFCNEVPVSAGWNAESMEPNAYHKARI